MAEKKTKIDKATKSAQKKVVKKVSKKVVAKKPLVKKKTSKKKSLSVIELEERYSRELEEERIRNRSVRVAPETSVSTGKLFLVVFMAAIVIFLIWLAIFRYNIYSLGQDAKNSEEVAKWESVKQDIAQILDEVKRDSRDLSKTIDQEADNSQGLASEAVLSMKKELIAQVTADWQVYTNEDHGFSIKYPADWEVSSDGNGIQFTKDEAAVVIVIQPEIPRVPLPEELIEDFSLDGLPAKLYHDASLKDGEPIDKVIADLPDSEDDIYLAGYGEVFSKMIYTFKFIK